MHIPLDHTPAGKYLARLGGSPAVNYNGTHSSYHHPRAHKSEHGYDGSQRQRESLPSTSRFLSPIAPSVTPKHSNSQESCRPAWVWHWHWKTFGIFRFLPSRGSITLNPARAT